MDSTMTITQWENELNGTVEGRKIAKLFQDKANVMSDKYYATALAKLNEAVAPKYTRVLDMFGMTIIDNRGEMARPTGARKLRVNPIVRDSSTQMFCDAISDGVAVKTPVVVSVSLTPETKSEPEGAIIQIPNGIIEGQGTTLSATVTQEVPSNVGQFPTERVATRSEMTVSETPSNVVQFPTERVAMRSDASNENTLSRFARMDYSSDVVNKVENSVSIDDYLQHKSTKANDQDIATLMENGERLDSEIVKSQNVIEQLEAQLNNLKEIREAQRQERITALEEENLSKTATLNGLTEQIRALQEAIRLEQESVNEGSIGGMRRAA